MTKSERVLAVEPSCTTAAMAFFQAALLGGYAYAHALQRLPYRRTRQIQPLRQRLTGVKRAIGQQTQDIESESAQKKGRATIKVN